MGAEAEVTVVAKGKDEGGSKVLGDVGDAAVDAKKDVDRLGDSKGPEELSRDIVAAEQDLKGLFDAFKRAERALQQAELGEGFDKAGKEAQKLRRDVVAAGRAVAEFADKNPQVQGVGKAFKGVRAATKRARVELEKFNKTGSGLGKVAKSITSLRAGVAALLVTMAVNVIQRFTRGAFELGEASLQIKARLDGASLALKETLGSATAAGGGLEFLEDVSDRLGLAVSSMTEKFVSLSAATKGTAVAGKDTEEVFEALVTTGVAFGKSQEEIGRAITAVSQIAGKGVAQMEELRQQLGENLPGALQALAKGLGEIRPDFDGTVASLFELTAAGKLTAEEAIPALTIGLNDLAGTAADEAMGTLAGQLRTVSKTAEEARIELADKLEPGALRLLETINKNRDAIGEFAAGLGGLFSDIADGIGRSIEALDDVNRGLEGFAREFPALFDSLGLDDFKEALLDAGDAGEKAFDRISEAAILSGQGIIGATDEAAKGADKSFDDIRRSGEEAFRELTKEVELSTGGRQSLEEELATELGKIADRDIQHRNNLIARLADAVERSAKDRLQIEQSVFESVGALAERQKKANDEAVEAAIRGARRVELAEKASADRRAEQFEANVVLAESAARQRVETESEAAESIAKIEERLAEKIATIRAKFLDAVNLEADKRIDVETELAAELDRILVKAAQDREALEQKSFASAKKNAEERIALAKKVADETIAANDRVRAAAAAPGEGAADTPGAEVTGGSAIAQTTVEIGAATQSLEALRAEAERLQSIGAQGAGLLDPAGILRTKQAFDDARVATQQFAAVATESATVVAAAQDELNTRAQAVLEAIARELEERLKLKTLTEEQIATAEIFSGVLSSQIDTLAQLAEQGIVTNEDIQALAETFSLYSDETAPASVEANQSIQESLTALAEKQKEQTEATEDGTKARESEIKVVKEAGKATEIFQAVKQDLKKVDEEVVKPTEELAAAFEAEGEAAGAAAGPTGELATNLDAVKEGAAGAGGSVGELATAAEQLSQVMPPDELAAAITSIGRDAPGAADGVNAIAEALQAVNDKLDELRKVVAAVAQLKIEAAAAAAELNNAATAAQNLANTEQGL